MALVDECARTEALVNRAQSLFAPDAQLSTAPEQAAASLLTGARVTAGTAGPMSAVSGALVATHQALADELANKVSAAAQADTMLGAQLHRAATLTEVGARRLDALAVQARANTMAAVTGGPTGHPRQPEIPDRSDT